MTFTGTDTINQAVKAFKKLEVNDQLSVLASMYIEIKDALSTTAPTTSSTKEIGELVQRVKDFRSDEQLQFLQDILSEKKTKNETVELDLHPSQAMLELLPGGSKPPISQYHELGNNPRLVFWYQFAQQMKGDLMSTIQGYSASSDATELLDSLTSFDLEETIAFLNQVL